MTRILATGDWHVGSGLDYGATPQDRLADQRQVAERIVDLALEHRPDAVLLAGDLWHRRRPSPAELLAVWEPLQRLHRDSMCDVLAICGNHCVEASDNPVALDLFTDFIDVHRTPGIWRTRGCTVATLPWAPVSRLVAARDGGDRDTLHAEAAELLLATARGLRERIDGPAVLLLHWSISGAIVPNGTEVGPDFGVALPAPELEALGFRAVVAGHIHKPQPLYSPHSFYVGSPAPVDFGEAESAHGCWLLDTDDEMGAEFLPIESRPFVTLDLTPGDLESRLLFRPHGDSSGMRWPENWTGTLTDAVVRVRFTATEEQARRIDPGEIRRALYAAGAHKVYAIQPTIIRAERARVEGVTEELAPLAAVDAWVAANEVGPDEHKRLAGVTREYLEAVQ